MWRCIFFDYRRRDIVEMSSSRSYSRPGTNECAHTLKGESAQKTKSPPLSLHNLKSISSLLIIWHSQVFLNSMTFFFFLENSYCWGKCFFVKEKKSVHVARWQCLTSFFFSLLSFKWLACCKNKLEIKYFVSHLPLLIYYWCNTASKYPSLV